jgi:hypothetical protein
VLAVPAGSPAKGSPAKGSPFAFATGGLPAGSRQQPAAPAERLLLLLPHSLSSAALLLRCCWLYLLGPAHGCRLLILISTAIVARSSARQSAPGRSPIWKISLPRKFPLQLYSPALARAPRPSSCLGRSAANANKQTSNMHHRRRRRWLAVRCAARGSPSGSAALRCLASAAAAPLVHPTVVLVCVCCFPGTLAAL